MGTHADLLKLLLPAVAYDKSGPALSAEIAAHAARLDAFQAFSDTLLVETDPRTTDVLLDDWERVYGLPGSCTSLGGSVDARRANLLAKVAETGGLSSSYFLHLAEFLGYADTTITQCVPLTCDMYCDSYVRAGDLWRFVWIVNLPHQGDNYTVFEADSQCDALIDSYVFGALECMFMRLKPAHTYVIFTYEGFP